MADSNIKVKITAGGMQQQLAIGEAPDAKIPLAVRFEHFHETNPHVYQELVMLARRAKRTGASKIGIGQLFEILRWRHMLSTHGDLYLLNNNYRAFYSRLIMDHEPDLTGFFDIRASVADLVE